MDGVAYDAGVLLAAGRSRRMGTPKQLLPVPVAGGRAPMVCASFDLLAPLCPDRMVVVTGHEAGRVREALGPRRFVEARSDPDADMLTSVRVGLAAALAQFPDAAAVWLHLADVPLVDPRTPTELRRAFEAAGGQRAVMPEHADRGGHPAIIPRALATDICGWEGDGGLREFWRLHAQRCVREPVTDPGVVRDLDTPGAYEAAIGGA